METEAGISRDSFLILAAIAGLDANDPHMDDLYPFVQTTLAGLKALSDIDVTSTSRIWLSFHHGIRRPLSQLDDGATPSS
jgi:hypothetical protein